MEVVLPIDSMNHPIRDQVMSLEYLRRVDVCIVSKLRDGELVALVTLQDRPVHKVRAVENSIRDEVVIE